MKKCTLIIIFISTILSCKEESKNTFLKNNILIKYNYEIINDTKNKSRFYIRLPKTYENRQYIKKISYDPKPKEIQDRHFSTVAYFELQPKVKEVKIEVNIEVYKYDYTNATLTQEESIQDIYLIHDGNQELINMANKVKADSIIKTIDNIISNSPDVITYKLQENENNYLSAITDGYGDCTEFTDLFVQLCRVNGIPAREVYGYLFMKKSYDWGYNNHAWAEVYLEDKGWVPVETIADSSLVKYFPSIIKDKRIYVDIYDGEDDYFYSYNDDINIIENIEMELIN